MEGLCHLGGDGRRQAGRELYLEGGERPKRGRKSSRALEKTKKLFFSFLIETINTVFICRVLLLI